MRNNSLLHNLIRDAFTLQLIKYLKVWKLKELKWVERSFEKCTFKTKWWWVINKNTEFSLSKVTKSWFFISNRKFSKFGRLNTSLWKICEKNVNLIWNSEQLSFFKCIHEEKWFKMVWLKGLKENENSNNSQRYLMQSNLLHIRKVENEA